MRRSLVVALLCALVMSSSETVARPGSTNAHAGQPIAVSLINGDTVSGTLVSVDDLNITIQHLVLGDLVVPRNAVQSPEHLKTKTPVPTAPPEESGDAPATETPTPAQDEQAPKADADTKPAAKPAADPEPPPPTKPADPPPPLKPKAEWKTRVALGFNGSQGRRTRLSGRADVGTTRKTEHDHLEMAVTYAVASDTTELIENRFTATARNTWKYPKTRLEAFAEGQGEVDEFRRYDARLTAGGGVAYRFVQNDKTRFLTRTGVGGTREIGGSNEIVPEAIVGFELSHKLNDRNKLTAQGSVWPALDDIEDVRSRSRATWEILIDPELKLTLLLGLENRYDSELAQGQKNQIDYFAQIVLSF